MLGKLAMVGKITPNLAHGAFWPRTVEGYICNDCRGDRLQAPWSGLVTAWVAACRETFGDRLHSLYLRGSIPRGQGIPGLSDLDGIIVTHHPLEPTGLAALHHLSQALSRRYLFCRRVEMLPLTPGEITDSQSALLATQGLHLWGEDLIPTLPPVRPGPDLISHLPHLRQDLDRAMTRLRTFPRATVHQGPWICRRLVRSGFELVMTREGEFTRDLGLCAARFAAHYPAQAASMGLALALALNPTRDRAGLLLFLQQFGPWLVEEGDRHLHQI